MAGPKVYVTPVTAGLSPVGILALGAITGIANTLETTILSYTALGDETVGDIVMGGTSYARYNIYLNTALVFVLRSGPTRQCNLALQRPLQLAAGDIIDVKVIHYNLTWTDDFEATILGV